MVKTMTPISKRDSKRRGRSWEYRGKKKKHRELPHKGPRDLAVKGGRERINRWEGKRTTRPACPDYATSRPKGHKYSVSWIGSTRLLRTQCERKGSANWAVGERAS